ncbi:MAG: hypothetical protein ACLTW9_18570 [Enterocloster sp.]
MSLRRLLQGGPLAFVKDGDILSYSVEKRSLELVNTGEEVSSQEALRILEEREEQEGLQPRSEAAERLWPVHQKRPVRHGGSRV